MCRGKWKWLIQEGVQWHNEVKDWRWFDLGKAEIAECFRKSLTVLESCHLYIPVRTFNINNVLIKNYC